MKLIPLTQGKFAKVDDEDYEKLSKFKWYVGNFGTYQYAVRNVTTTRGQRQIRMHRAILKAPKAVIVDHINHDTLDNQRANLRMATKSENCQNSKSRGTNRLKGVCYRPRNKLKPWNANLWNGKKFLSLGHFTTELEAHEAYKKEAQKLHGQFYYET